MNKDSSFQSGWEYGNEHKRELTQREIAEQFPQHHADSFAQGMLDGIAGDKFRLQGHLLNIEGRAIIVQEREHLRRLLNGETSDGVRMGMVGLDEEWVRDAILQRDIILLDTEQVLEAAKHGVLVDIRQLSSGTIATLLSDAQEQRTGLRVVTERTYAEVDHVRDSLFRHIMYHIIKGERFDTWHDAWAFFQQD